MCMTPKPLITVLIDTFNHELFIEEAIRSVLEQNLQASEFEILVVDDGSTDGTPEIVRRFQPRVRLIRKKNGGQASAFNVGISEALGGIVVFLDGDDWWSPGKLAAVASAFASDTDLGLVGHGVTEVYPDGRQRTEIPREVCRYRIASVEQAKKFRLTRGFLGTSRMAYRKEILDLIGPIPEALKFEADEYLFTLAGLFADVMILRESFTFYRLHGGNLFQLTGQEDLDAVRRKQMVLVALGQALRKQLMQNRVPTEIAQIILECVDIEADILHLRLDSGFPWETVLGELKIMRVFHSDASIWQYLFSCMRLIPALVLPSRIYYRWRNSISKLRWYQDFRHKLLPFPVQSHIERTEKPAP
jgi:glycosyltransferase involved in cell wall biosynthesis